jgi:hypothetical protein
MNTVEEVEPVRDVAEVPVCSHYSGVCGYCKSCISTYFATTRDQVTVFCFCCGQGVVLSKQA